MGYKYTDEVHKLVAFKYEDEEREEKWFDGIDKAVLLNLAGRANNETGQCHPGYSLIAAETLFSKKSVERSVNVLRHVGFVTVVPPGKRKTTTYTLNLKLILDIVMAQDEGTLEKKPKRKGNFKKQLKEPVTLAKGVAITKDEVTFLDVPKVYYCVACGKELASKTGFKPGLRCDDCKASCPNCGKPAFAMEEADECSCDYRSTTGVTGFNLEDDDEELS